MFSSKRVFRENLKKNILSIPSKNQKELEVISYFKKFIHKKEIRTIISYYPDKYEVNPDLSFLNDVKIFFPSILNQKLCFIYPKSVKKGRYNILEPIGSEQIKPSDVDLCIIPSLGINSKGYRLGRGGGFYDKTFQGVDTLKLGFGFDESHICDFKEETYDMKFSFFITSKGILDF